MQTEILCFSSNLKTVAFHPMFNQGSAEIFKRREERLCFYMALKLLLPPPPPPLYFWQTFRLHNIKQTLLDLDSPWFYMQVSTFRKIYCVQLCTFKWMWPSWKVRLLSYAWFPCGLHQQKCDQSVICNILSSFLKGQKHRLPWISRWLLVSFFCRYSRCCH